jgi:hypothetical protein
MKWLAASLKAKGSPLPGARTGRRLSRKLRNAARVRHHRRGRGPWKLAGGHRSHGPGDRHAADSNMLEDRHHRYKTSPTERGTCANSQYSPPWPSCLQPGPRPSSSSLRRTRWRARADTAHKRQVRTGPCLSPPLGSRWRRPRMRQRAKRWLLVRKGALRRPLLVRAVREIRSITQLDTSFRFVPWFCVPLVRRCRLDSK